MPPTRVILHRLRQGTCLHPSILLVVPSSARCRPRTSGTCHRRNAPPPVARPYATIEMIPFKHHDAFSIEEWRPAVATTMVRIQQQEAKPRRTTNANDGMVLARKINWKDRKGRGCHVPPRKMSISHGNVVLRTRSNVLHVLSF
jgi:hypothetical protein